MIMSTSRRVKVLAIARATAYFLISSISPPWFFAIFRYSENIAIRADTFLQSMFFFHDFFRQECATEAGVPSSSLGESGEPRGLVDLV